MGSPIPPINRATNSGPALVRWQNGRKLYVASTGPAYPLHGEFTGAQARTWASVYLETVTCRTERKKTSARSAASCDRKGG